VIPEAPVERTEHGLVPSAEGWFVLDVRDARWWHSKDRAAICNIEGTTDFPQVGINLNVIAPGETMSMYHWEADQEDFLILAGSGLLIVEGEERPVHAWDFIHFPAGTNHAIVATDTTCVVLAIGARVRSVGPDWGGYRVDETASRHGVGVERETTKAKEAYAAFTQREPTAYRDGWLA